MGRKGNKNRSPNKKSNTTPKETEVLRDNKKGSTITKVKPIKQDSSTAAFKPLGDRKIRDENQSSAADMAGMVFGIIVGTMASGLVCPIGLVLMGPVGGVIISAGAAGLTGVAIKEILSKHVQRTEMLLSCLGFLALPVLIHLFGSGTETYKYDVEEAAPRSFVHV